MPEGERAKWLNRAREGGWSRATMRKKIKEYVTAIASAKKGDGSDYGGEERGEDRREEHDIGADQLLAVATQALDLARKFDQHELSVSAEQLDLVLRVADTWNRLAEILEVSPAEECVA